nr:putative late blight resistance protein homolog R1A-4 isoform X1 [Ipomoea batatas]
MVGRQNDVTAIKDLLFGEGGGQKVIPVIGMPGIGKTTLARTIFEDELVTQYFQLKVWFTMPQKYNEIQTLNNLFRSIILAVPEQHEIKDQGRALLDRAHECLIGQSSNNPRSIFFFQGNPEIFVPLKLLRVLAFVPPPFLQRLPMQLGDLIFLRYLSVTQWFEGLSDVLSTNVNLQTLIVSSSDSESQPILHLPPTIWESPQLRHLELGALYTIDPPSVVKKNLQTLSWVGPTHCRKEVYSCFPNIKKLKILCKEDIEPHIGGSSRKHTILDNLDYLAQLKSLTISVSSVGCIVRFPERCMFPSQLKKLSLSGTNLSGRDLTVIGSLKRLEVLKLENAFHKQVWRVAEGGFYGLKFLLLKAKKLKRLEAYTDSFPCLERLVLRCCHYLDEIPSSFGEIFCLKSIELDRCSRPSIAASAKDIQEKLKKNFGKANFEEPEYDDSGNILECDGNVGVGQFEQENFEIKIQEPEFNVVGKFKSYIHKLKNKRWRNLLRHKPKVAWRAKQI